MFALEVQYSDGTVSEFLCESFSEAFSKLRTILKYKSFRFRSLRVS